MNISLALRYYGSAIAMGLVISCCIMLPVLWEKLGMWLFTIPIGICFTILMYLMGVKAIDEMVR